MNLTVVDIAEAVLSDSRGRVEKRLEVKVGRILRGQGRAFPAQRVVKVAQGLSAGIAEASGDPLGGLIDSNWPDREARILAALVAEGGRAARLSGNYTLARIGHGMDSTPLPSVAERVRTRGLEAASSIDATSREKVRAIIARGVEAADSTDDIVRALRREFAGWGQRANLIARTETAFAWESTAHDVLVANGWHGRVWLTAKDERVDAGGFSGPCVDNEAAGVVPLDQAFPSGAMYPPEHPMCRCTTAPA